MHLGDEHARLARAGVAGRRETRHADDHVGDVLERLHLRRVSELRPDVEINLAKPRFASIPNTRRVYVKLAIGGRQVDLPHEDATAPVAV